MPNSAATTKQPAPRRVLVVEDDRFLLEMLGKMLEQAGFSVEGAPDGSDALEKAKTFMPEAVLCDVMMPGLSGLEVCRRLKEGCGPAFLPVLFLTARDDLASKLEGFSVGADDYIIKPFVPGEVVARLGVMLRLRDALAANLEHQRRKDEFLNIVSHDLRLPVAVISKFCKQLLNRTQPLSRSDFNAICRIGENADFMERMISYYLSHTTLSSGEIELYPVSVHLPALIDESLKRNQIHANSEGVMLMLEVGEDVPQVYIDENKFHQVLNNLLSNAIRFSPRGGRITVACHVEVQEVVITVADEGPGLTADVRERIFASSASDSPGPGPSAVEPQPSTGPAPDAAASDPPRQTGGLGLVISRRIVELHSGTFTVQTRLPTGSTFRIALPLRY